MSALPDITFKHRFASGREIVMTFTRKPNEMPSATASMQYEELTESERLEFLPWVEQVSNGVTDSITKGEVRAAAKRGKKIIQDCIEEL